MNTSLVGRHLVAIGLAFVVGGYGTAGMGSGEEGGEFPSAFQLNRKCSLNVTDSRKFP